MEVAEDVARQAVALLQAQSIDVAIIKSTVEPFLRPYHAAVDLVALADDAPWPRPTWWTWSCRRSSPRRRTERATTSRPSSATPLSDVAVPVTTDEQVALLTSFETAHREQVTRQFMVAEREALATMLVVRASGA
jgi:hypothetical protein